jgi:hypothetical protein
LSKVWRYQRILITLWYLQTFDHCVVCPSIYRFWLPLWPLQTFGHCVVCSSIYGYIKTLTLQMTNPRTFWVKFTSKCLGNNYKYKDIIISIAELKRYESSYYPIWSPENIIVEFEYTKEVIRIRKSKNKQHNYQMKKNKQWSTKQRLIITRSRTGTFHTVRYICYDVRNILQINK